MHQANLVFNHRSGIFPCIDGWVLGNVVSTAEFMKGQRRPNGDHERRVYTHTPSYGSSTYGVSDFGHFELPPFPEVAALGGPLAAWRYRPIDFQLLVSLSSVCLQTRFALHLFALLCYTL
jgi:hypothetical protein